MIINACKEISTHFDHYDWKLSAKPDENANIINVSSEKVKYVKNGAKFRTRVEFSDGFRFETYKTKSRIDSFSSYTISNEPAIQAAIEKHKQEVAKAKQKSSRNDA